MDTAFSRLRIHNPNRLKKLPNSFGLKWHQLQGLQNIFVCLPSSLPLQTQDTPGCEVYHHHLEPSFTVAIQQVYAVFSEHPCLGLSRVFVCLFFHREKVLGLQEFYILVGLTKLGWESSLPPAHKVTAHKLLHQISDTKPWGRSCYMKHWQRPCLQTQSFLSYFFQFYSILVAMSYILSIFFSIIVVYTPISAGHLQHVWAACFSWVYDDLWILDESSFSGQGDCEVWKSAWDFKSVFTGYFRGTCTISWIPLPWLLIQWEPTCKQMKQPQHEEISYGISARGQVGKFKV